MHSAPIDWCGIDTVLLDMDGTLLDLRFDNWFWQEHIPQRYAAVHGLNPPEAREILRVKFRASRGTIQWYCLDYWSEELGLDVAHLKRAVGQHVAYLPGAQEFLGKLRVSGKRRVLVTNAHPVTLAIKEERVRLAPYFDACYSTHAFSAPKEHPSFWPRLQGAEPFVSARTLFVDDSLPVLEAAHAFGIAHIRAVRRPDSGQPPQSTGGFAAVDRVADLFAES